MSTRIYTYNYKIIAECDKNNIKYEFMGFVPGVSFASIIILVAELVGHGSLLNGELCELRQRIGDGFNGGLVRNKDELINVEEEHPSGHESVPMQAIIHDQKLIMIIPIKSLLILYIM